MDLRGGQGVGERFRAVVYVVCVKGKGPYGIVFSTLVLWVVLTIIILLCFQLCGMQNRYHFDYHWISLK